MNITRATLQATGGESGEIVPRQWNQSQHGGLYARGPNVQGMPGPVQHHLHPLDGELVTAKVDRRSSHPFLLMQVAGEDIDAEIGRIHDYVAERGDGSVSGDDIKPHLQPWIHGQTEANIGYYLMRGKLSQQEHDEAIRIHRLIDRAAQLPGMACHEPITGHRG